VDIEKVLEMYSEQISMIKIAKHFECDKRIIRKILSQKGVLRKGHGGWNLVDVSGRRFGSLVVKEKIDNLDGRTDSKWLCICDCGSETQVVRSSLVSGATRSCGCFKKTSLFKGVGDLSKSYWNRIVKGADKRNLQLNITMEDAWNQYEKQERKCALTGLPIQIVTDYTHKHDEHTASLDRIDNKVGYLIDNIQWVHRDLNMMRKNFEIEKFIDYCQAVAKWSERSLL